MRRYIIISIISFCLIGHVASQTDSSFSEKSRLKLVFAGDIMGHDEQITGAWNADSSRYNYEPTFRYVKPFIQQADIAIANLEVTLAGPPFKGYPQFSSPDALAIAARDAGFDVFIQANNHALDRGTKGFRRTINILDSLQIVHTGTFYDSTDRALNYPLILEKNGIRIAILNYTYGTNGLVINKPSVINRIDTSLIRQDLQKAKLANPDFIILTVHWGEEYQRAENSNQKKLALFAFENGADIIIGSHPHVVQPIKEFYSADSLQKHIVVYSQGNFVSNQRAQYKDGGIFVELDIMKTSGATTVENFNYMPVWVYRKQSSGKYTFYVVPVMYWENNPEMFNLSEADQFKIRQFSKDTRELLKNMKESDFFRTKQ